MQKVISKLFMITVTYEPEIPIAIVRRMVESIGYSVSLQFYSINQLWFGTVATLVIRECDKEHTEKEIQDQYGFELKRLGIENE